MKRLFLITALLCISCIAYAQEPLVIQGAVRKTVDTIKPASVSLNHEYLYVFPGDKPQLSARISPANAFNKNVTWESSNPQVATVDAAGNIIPVAQGTAIVRVYTQEGRHTDACTVDVDLKNLYGNTSGNVINKGYVASQGRWIYYADPDNGMGLSKIRKDGTGKVRLCSDRVSYINVSGHSIYFVNESQGGKLFRMDLNGERKSCLNDTDTGVRNVQLYGTWVYYLTQEGAIYLISTGGQNRSKLGDVSNAHMFTLADDWIYYRTESGIYKIRRNGGDKKKHVSASSTSYPIWDRNALYYKISTNGLCRKVGSDDSKRYGISLFGAPNVADGWVYYVSDADRNQVKKIHSGGTLDQELAQGPSIARIFVADEWVFYYTGSPNEASALFRVGTDGLHRQRM